MKNQKCNKMGENLNGTKAVSELKPLLPADRSVVYNLDCMEYLPQYDDNHFELAIVDPPYGNNTKADVGTGEYSRNWLNNRNGDWDNRPDAEYWKELYRISKNQIIFGANFFPLPPSRGYVCWYKSNEVKGRDFSEFELAYTSFDKPSRHFECKPFIRNGNRIHPTQKPVKLYEWLLKNYANEGDKILDTHVGSGSSRIACYKMGFQFTGFEIDEEYWFAQEERFNNFKRQLTLF